MQKPPPIPSNRGEQPQPPHHSQTVHVAQHAPAAATKPPEKKTIWGKITLIAGAVTAVAGSITAITQLGVFGKDDKSAESRSSSELEKRVEALDEELRKQREKELEQKIAAMEAKLENRNENEGFEANQGSLVAGSWQGGNGLTYFFTQAGNYVTFQEISAYRQVLAAGQGSLSGKQINLDYLALDGSIGSLELSVSGNQISGTIHNHSMGTSSPVVMSRR